MPLAPLPLDIVRGYQVTLSGSFVQPSLAGVFTGTEVFEVLLRRGDDLPAAATLPAAWDPTVTTDPAGNPAVNPSGLEHPIVLVTFDGPALAAAGVGPGIYLVRGRINPAAVRVLFLDETIELTAAPGAGIAPPVYCERSDLLDALPAAEGGLDLTVHQTGYREARAAARAWTERTVLARAEDALRDAVQRHVLLASLESAGVDLGASRYGAYDVWYTVEQDLDAMAAIRAALAADRLLVDDTCRRANAFYALGEILSPSSGGEIGQYGTTPDQKKGAGFNRKALGLLRGWTARLDVDGDGVYETELNP